MQELHNDCIVRLHGVLEDRMHIYMVMDFIPGGNLFDYIIQRHILPEPHVQFYVTDVVAALRYLHTKHILFRDLKPENLMLTASGHLLLVDFGFAKQMTSDDQRTYTRCGTKSYEAPEIGTKRGHGKPVDIWALGILVFEMLTGDVPAHYGRLNEENRKCPLSADWLQFPSYMQPISDGGRDFIRALLIPEPSKRLCCDGGDHDIGKHGWWQRFDPEDVAGAVQEQQIHRPCSPAVNASHIPNTVPYSEFHRVLISKV